MTNPTYFTVVADFKPVVADLASDADADPTLGPISARVTFAALLKSGDVMLATNASPRPTGFIAAPIVARIDTDGRLKLRVEPDGDRDDFATMASFPEAGSAAKVYFAIDTQTFYRWDGAEYIETYPYAPVRLLADTPLLELSGDLYYRCTFSNVVYNGGSQYIAPFTFQAPNADTELNLITVMRQPGQPASGITKITPGGVRGEDGALVFSFAGVDIPDPVPIDAAIGDVVSEQLAPAVDAAVVAADLPGQVEAVVAAELPGVVEAELPAVTAEQIPPLVAVEVSTGLAAANIPGLVVATIAEDASVIAAAEAAVDDAVTGTDVVTGSTTSNDADIHFGLRDSVGRQQLIAKSDGTVSIPLPTMAGLKVRAADSAQRYAFGLRDSAGRIAENAIGLDGQVPGWVLTRWADRMGWGSTASRDWLIVCAGQSNMAGNMIDTPSGVYDVDSRLVYYNSLTDTLDTVGTAEGALWATIGRELVKAAPSDVRVIVVNAAVGGSGFYAADSAGTWDRTVTTNPNGNNYDKMVTATTAARVLAPDAKMAGFFWSQGENDTIFFTEAEYAAKLDDLIGAFRTAMSAPDLPAVIGSMVPEWVADNSGTPGVGYGSAAERLRIQKALIDTPRRLVKSSFVYGPVGMANPAGIIHFVTAGMRARGAAMVAALERAYWNFIGALPVPPQNLRLARSGTTLTATWDAPPTRHTAFTVEFSTNGGSTWSAMTKPDGVIGLSATATISTSDVVQVRASTTNDTTATPTSGYVYATI